MLADPPVAVEFVNNTPEVVEGGVMVMLQANRPDAEMQCQILRMDHHKDNCTCHVHVYHDCILVV